MAGRRRHLLVGATVLVLALAGRTFEAARSAPPGYRVSAYFKEAIALYPQSAVKVMGATAGRVDRITVEGSRVRVDMTINHDVPIPTNVMATINALTVIGERNVILSPPWKPGDDTAGPGFVIPDDHTTTPVEPDDAIRAFRDFARAIDPKVITNVIRSGVTAFGGHEQSFNDLLASAASVSSTLASQDDRIIKAAANLHELASLANAREQQLGHVIDAFSQASGLLADERQQLGSILSGANRFIDSMSSLLTAYQGTLPDDLANLSRLGLTLQANEKVFSDLFSSFPAVGQGLIDAYDPSTNTVRLGANVGPSLNGILDAAVGRVLERLGLGVLVPCLRIPSPCT